MSDAPRPPHWLIRRADQAVLAVSVLLALGAMIAWFTAHGGWRGRLIEIDRADPLSAQFQVDVNQADWPELMQLPGIGPTLAHRIVESRQTFGPFADHEDLRRVQGIGPKTLERIRPHLAPVPGRDVAAR